VGPSDVSIAQLHDYKDRQIIAYIVYIWNMEKCSVIQDGVKAHL